MPGVGRALITRWMTKKWLVATVVALAFFVVCLLLGQWQWGRHEDKLANRERIETYYTASPVPLDSVLSAGSGGLSDADEWRRVTVTGVYDQGAQQLIRNRPQNGTYGYEVAVPLQLGDGTSVLVDRGWLPNAERADVLPEVPPAPGGQVRVEGWVRPGEPTINQGLPEGQLASISLDQAQQATGHRLRGAYLVLASEDDGRGSPPPRPAPLVEPGTGLGPHFAYAVQWWGASALGFAIVFVYLRREVRDEMIDAGELAPAAAKPRKLRVWDEEDA